VRAVVFTGAGSKASSAVPTSTSWVRFCADSARLFITRLHMACKAIRDCPVPVIGRINGFCLGAGLELAACCDMRAAARARSSACRGAHGHPVGDRGGRCCRPDRLGPHPRDAADGRALFGAEALDMGLVQKVAPLSELDAAIEPWIEGLLRATPEACARRRR
jgi:enoyl-CoA hydratase/carnithine racemase